MLHLPGEALSEHDGELMGRRSAARGGKKRTIPFTPDNATQAAKCDTAKCGA